jgi:hypothetical protein
VSDDTVVNRTYAAALLVINCVRLEATQKFAASPLLDRLKTNAEEESDDDGLVVSIRRAA